MIAKETISFLRELEKNNDRDWFQANKSRYDAANANVVAMADQLIGMIAKFDPAVVGLDPRRCVFRIYRDVRFSKDKSPYKTNLGAAISPGGKMAPGYYFHIQPKMYFSAAGKHMPDAAEMLRVRQAISTNAGEFRKIVEGKRFRERFGELHGDRLSRPPKGFSPVDPAVEYLKLKSFTVAENFDESEALSAEYPKMLAESFKAAFPFVAFLREALADK